MTEAPAKGKSPSTRPTNPCHTCRHKHLKCDDKQPSCANCTKSKIECVRGFSVRFRHKLNPSVRRHGGSGSNRGYNFTDDQPWIKTSRRLSFVNETEDTIGLYHTTSNSSDSGIPRPGSSPRTSPCPRPDGSPRSIGVVDESSTPPEPPWTAQIKLPDWNGTDAQSNTDDHIARSWGSDSTAGVIPSPGFGQTSLTEASPSGMDLDAFHAHHTPSALEGGPTDQNVTTEAFPDEESWLMLARSLDAELLTPPDSSDTPMSNIYLDTPRFQLRNPLEAKLWQYYVVKIAPLFDMCDLEQRHFATVVPQRAASCPLLTNAILAAAAKRMSKAGDVDPRCVDRYHQKCLNLLIPALSTNAAVVNEDVLTAVVILRYLEELDVPISAPMPQSHLIGTRIFLASQGQPHNFTGLRLAVYWLALRQEIYVALVQSRPVHCNFALDEMENVINLDPHGSGYANKVIIHTAHCLNFCYGSEEQRLSDWVKLREFQDRWWNERPWYYNPVFTGEPTDGGLFPQEMYLNDAVVTGLQHYLLAKILLLAHNPSSPRLGPGQVLAFRAMNEEIKQIACQIIGIAESNTGTPPAMVNACLAITMAGDRFTEKHEQEALFRILVKTDLVFAWPTNFAQDSLRKSWGWDDSLPHPDMSIAGILNSGGGQPTAAT